MSFPRDWHYGTEAAIMPAVERSREQNYDRPAVSPSQRALLKACERTLVSAWRKMPEETGEIAYEDFGEVTISAMSLACFPNVKFPDVARWQRIADATSWSLMVLDIPSFRT